MSITSNFIWTWINGVSDFNPPNTGSVGSTGTPKGRSSATTWVDANDILYLFSGESNSDTALNDLWTYNPGTNQWTFIQDSIDTNGSPVYGTTPSISNRPGGRKSTARWVGPDGKFYLFGGFGQSATASAVFLNDMWRLDPSNYQWTWIGGFSDGNRSGVYSGTNQIPGGRSSPIYWTAKNGLFYLFGGLTTASAHLNDLWQFNPTTLQWTYLASGGSNTTNQTASYFVAPLNPGARSEGRGWIGLDGNLYLFGGYNGANLLNDVWKYDLSTNVWIWLKGSNMPNQNGIYGPPYITRSDLTPGARARPAAWTTSNGNFFIFGGNSYPASGSLGIMNDLWVFDTKTNNWTFIKGSSDITSPGFFGVKNTPAEANLPPARSEALAWVRSADDSLYLFGGLEGLPNWAGDLWKGTMPCDFSISDAYTFPLTITSGQPFNISWQLIPTIFPTNYQAIVTFKGSDYTNIFTGLTGSISLPGQPIGLYSDIRLKLVSRSMNNCSDSRSLNATVIDGATLTLLLSFLPSLIIVLIIIYMAIIGFFLYDVF